jgi:hypothetical protein
MSNHPHFQQMQEIATHLPAGFVVNHPNQAAPPNVHDLNDALAIVWHWYLCMGPQLGRPEALR